MFLTTKISKILLKESQKSRTRGSSFPRYLLSSCLIFSHWTLICRHVERRVDPGIDHDTSLFFLLHFCFLLDYGKNKSTGNRVSRTSKCGARALYQWAEFHIRFSPRLCIMFSTLNWRLSLSFQFTIIVISEHWKLDMDYGKWTYFF